MPINTINGHSVEVASIHEFLMGEPLNVLIIVVMVANPIENPKGMQVIMISLSVFTCPEEVK